MKTDRYTKIVLTVIAACMVINVFEKTNIIPKAYAGNATLAIAPTPAPGYGLVPLNPDGSINATFKAVTPMDVNIVGIRTSDGLDVNVNLEKIGGYNTYGEIPVKVKE